MKNRYLKSKLAIVSAFLLILTSGCNEFLEVEPLDKVNADQLLTSENGLKTLLANLYNAVPMEDFNYRPNEGFYNRGIGDGRIVMTSMFSDEAIRSDGQEAIGPPGERFNYFDYAYQRNRDVSLFLESIEKAKNNQVIDEATYNRLESEAHFVRAYIYFGLVKRYGGIPIIETALDDLYVPGSDNEALYIPRSKEKDCWDFILKECDKAITNLPVTLTDGKFRASKWTAYALKSRVALYAASLAKYWNNAPLTGEAVNQGYVGMSATDANYFYGECISASKEIIDKSGYSLYMPDPSSPAEAAANYQNLFLTSNNEIIFSRTYMDGSLVSNQGHSYDAFYSPSQAHPGYLRHGRYSPTLDIVDIYEDYTDNGTGESAKIVTRTDGKENYSVGDPNTIDVNAPFKKYENLSDPFKDKDARLAASIIVPGAIFKNVRIVIQGGLIGKNGNVMVYSAGSEVGHDGVTYYTYGAASPTGYSGFDNLGRGFENSNFSCSGFTVRKYLAENKNLVVGSGTSVSTTPWIDMRLGEVYLNYAEAVVESGQGDATAAKGYLNKLRKRAGHTDEIPLTLANVLKERKVELAFEGLRYDDMFRRRDYHTFFNVGRRHALVPLLDLREQTPKYIFVRANLYYDEQVGGRTFNPVDYYLAIPSTQTNRLTQNPGH